MLVTETFHGFIETTQDVLLIFEGCRRGLLPRICRRLQEKERKMIQSGSVFVFDERESGIKRWTDGRVWSPSRILGNFLIYRELDKRAPGEKRYSASTATSAAAAGDMRQRSYSADLGVAGASSPDAAGGSGGGGSMDRSRERQLVGSLSDSYKFRRDGLIKKTMSIVVNGVAQHLISYYHPNDVLQGNLRSPTSVPELASLEISPELLVKQNFRIPPMVEPAYDRPGNESSSSPLTPPDSLTGSYGDRRMHQTLRSMSVGSLRVPDNITHPHLVYQTPYHRLENGDQKFAAPGATPQSSLPAIYNTGYAIPSPTSLSSSPSTPMLSPVRQSYHQQQHHQRHYSTSSASYPRSYNSNDLVSLSSQQHHHPSQSPQQHTQDLQHLSHHQQQQHTPSLPDIGFFTNHNNATGAGVGGETNSSSIKQESQEARGGEQTTRYASNANLGQLLNPVHPLHNVSETTGTNSTTTTTTTTTQAQQLYNPMTASGQGYSYDNAAATAGQEDTTVNNNTSQSSSSGSPIDNHHHHHHNHHHHQHQQGGGGSIGIDGYMYYHDRQHSLTNSQHLPDQDAASLYPKSLLNPFFAHLSLHDGEATDADLTGAGTGLMLK
ncbi:Gti1/Pac2 family-domain-containing protein [Zychaea mexicana]|uniref:Gti1/Pac2 family-domain-containing protein n=1 Tax=Zychaea mexicana TaxID=64656 RepID=UPI0022FF1FB9|nr:Gti1/Pac2 family-domain-containing protein [Zychaea mexicana]KAI9496314.1 Gti1/Pac2 family-domain-containing protein [Zychaea mexicana]